MQSIRLKPLIKQGWILYHHSIKSALSAIKFSLKVVLSTDSFFPSSNALENVQHPYGVI